MEIVRGKMSSDVVRRNWRDVLDYVEKRGQTVLVSRSTKPVAAIIPYEDFVALVVELEDLHDMRSATRNLAQDLLEGHPDSLRSHAERKEDDPAWAAEVERVAEAIKAGDVYSEADAEVVIN